MFVSSDGCDVCLVIVVDVLFSSDCWPGPLPIESNPLFSNNHIVKPWFCHLRARQVNRRLLVTLVNGTSRFHLANGAS